jgi:hypothetical protein
MPVQSLNNRTILAPLHHFIHLFVGLLIFSLVHQIRLFLYICALGWCWLIFALLSAGELKFLKCYAFLWEITSHGENNATERREQEQ